MTVMVNTGTYRQVVTLSAPGTPAADGDGGYTQAYTLLSPPEWRCAIEKATVSNGERHFASTVIAQATHIFTGRFHAGISTQTRMVWVDRAGDTHTANVIDVEDPEGAGVLTVAAATEVTT